MRRKARLRRLQTQELDKKRYHVCFMRFGGGGEGNNKVAFVMQTSAVGIEKFQIYIAFKTIC